MEKTIRTQFVKEFLEAVLTLESVDECMDFFEDVCTVKEVQSIAQRFAVAKLLKMERLMRRLRTRQALRPRRSAV